MAGGGAKGLRAALLAVLAVVLLFACATPGERLDARAAEAGFGRSLVQGTDFSHVVYRKDGVGRLLHVYMAGDGTPWLNRTFVAADPTPRNSLILQVMAQDPAPALYLGRPCYHDQARRPPCSPLLWTARRYAPEVVDSMAAALAAVLERGEYSGLVFIGHSGGGTLAMLLAERFENTRAVLTVAGNLDPDAWTAQHGYSPLAGSLNPARRPPLPPRIRQLHLVGGRDENVPPRLIRSALASQPDAAVVVFETFDHGCCWERVWPLVLERLRAAVNRCL